MQRAIFKYIEFEIYNFDETKRQLAIEKDNILLNKDYTITDMPRSSKISRVTETKAINLISSIAIVRMERTINGIEKALTVLNADHRELFELKYRQGKEMVSVCLMMPTSERTYYRLRKELVETVGFYLGLINEKAGRDVAETIGQSVLKW